MSEHALFSPSSLARVFACPGSHNLTKDLPNTTSPFAERGTMLHEVAEHILRGQEHPKIDPGELQTLMGYVDYVRDLGGKQFYEVRLKLNDDIWGTADCIAICGTVLNVVDLKCGQGVKVDAANNVQLMTYGLMAYEAFSDIYNIDTVTLHIIQPWLNHYDCWEVK